MRTLGENYLVEILRTHSSNNSPGKMIRNISITWVYGKGPYWDQFCIYTFSY